MQESSNSRVKIVIADDDKDLVQLLYYLLEDDYEVHRAYSGIEALKLVATHNPELVLLDYMMPDMTGMEVLKTIREEHAISFVIIVTGQGSEEIAVNLLKAGATDYIIKPFRNEHILEVVRNALKLRDVTIQNWKLNDELYAANKRLKETAFSLEVSNRNLEKRVQELAKLHSLSIEINRVLEIEPLLDRLLQSMSHHFTLDHSMITLFDNEDLGAWHTFSSRGKLFDSHDLSSILQNTTIIKAINSHKPLLLSFEKDEGPRPMHSHSLGGVVLPLISENALIGVYYGETETLTLKDFGDTSLFHTIANQLSVSVQNARLFEQLSKSYFDTAFALATAVEAKDQVTGGHIERVTRYAIQVGVALKLSDEEIRTLQLGATLHDIGKIGISDQILCKAGKLTDEEFEIIKTHPLIGDTIIANIDSLETVRPIVRHHHERWDGTGYPDGLSGADIPLFARVISIVDVFDVVTHDRPYRPALTWDGAIKELMDNSGTQFDPNLIELFVKNLDTFPLMPKKGERKIRSFS